MFLLLVRKTNIMALVPQNTGDIIALIVNIILIMLAFFIVDYISARGETTLSYWLRLLAIALILIFIPPLADSLFAEIDSFFDGAINTSGVSPYVAFVIGIYSVKLITVKQGRHEPPREWENSIWLTFFAFLIILVITSFIDWLAANT